MYLLKGNENKTNSVRPIINLEIFRCGAYNFIWLFCWFVQIVIGEAHHHTLNQSSVNVVKFERVEHDNKLDVHHVTG